MKRVGKNKKQTAFVGMSGGVDSSVSAALLQQAGYDVTGVFIRVWEPEGFACTWREDRREAMRVAAVLNIPLVTIDLSKEYEREVVDYMIREYKAGRTPNPDVECNRAVKFGAFYQWAIKRGADFVATGHYARIIKKQTIFSLAMSADDDKDQTYFLWTLKPEQIKHCLFPVGGYKKREVRKLAKHFKLPNFAKKDSQGLCFIGKLDVKKFLQKYIKVKKGKVLNQQGEQVGDHDGAWFYTIGERHHGYIVQKDVKKNILIVSDKLLTPESGKSVKLENVNWTAGQAPDTSRQHRARIRHRGELLACRLERVKRSATGAWQAIFPQAPTGIAPGQSLVLYDGEVCLGGGVMA